MWHRLALQRELQASGQAPELPGDASRLNVAKDVLEDENSEYLVLPLLGDDLFEVVAALPKLDGRTQAFPRETAREYMKQVWRILLKIVLRLPTFFDAFSLKASLFALVCSDFRRPRSSPLDWTRSSRCECVVKYLLLGSLAGLIVLFFVLLFRPAGELGKYYA
jgi:hypothetical protein